MWNGAKTLQMPKKKNSKLDHLARFDFGDFYCFLRFLGPKMVIFKIWENIQKLERICYFIVLSYVEWSQNPANAKQKTSKLDHLARFGFALWISASETFSRRPPELNFDFCAKPF